jgi:tetratricopeptide (TPR) repeat protein
MAKGVLGGILGVLGGEPESSDDSIKVGAEAYAAAIAANLANQNPEVAKETAAFLRKQTELLEAQRKSVESDLAYFEAEWRPRLLGVRLRNAFQIFVALVATVIGLFAVLMIHDAVKSRSVVIDPFEAPPALAASGVNGKVLAAGLLDVLTRIQVAARSNAEHRSLSNAWDNDIAIEVPETGVSIGQLERILQARFGHDQHITGDLVQTKNGGLALTVRGSGVLPKTFSDDTGNIDVLLTQAGEYVYGQSQPGPFAAYLSNSGRNEDAVLFSRAAYAGAELSERPYLLYYWANAIEAKGDPGAMAKALPLYREALRLKPDFWNAYGAVMYTLGNLGDEEGEVRVGEQMIKAAGGRPGRAPEAQYQNFDATVLDLRAELAEQIADIESHGGVGTSGAAGGNANLNAAQIELQMHDLAAATLRLNTTPVDEKSIADISLLSADMARLAEEQKDFKTAAQAWDRYAAAYANPSISSSQNNGICFAALSYERTGQPAKANEALNPVGGFGYVDCYRMRADILDLRGDWAGAQEWYAKAVQLAPSIAAGYYAWGVALARHGNLDAAASKFKQANEKGPHWADPLKAWGDVLVLQGKEQEGIKKYDAALDYAPNWKDLKDARAAAAKRKSP